MTPEHDSKWNFQNLYSLLFMQAKVGVVLRDIKTEKIYEINQKYLDLVGRTRSEMMHLTFRDISEPGDQALQDELNRKMSSGEIKEYSVEKRYIKKSGETVWALVTCAAVWNNKSKPTELIAIAQDITESKLIDSTLRFITNIDSKPEDTFFFDAIASHLADTLNLAAVLIVQFSNNAIQKRGAAFINPALNATSIDFNLDSFIHDDAFQYFNASDAADCLIDGKPANTVLSFNKMLVKLFKDNTQRPQYGIICFTQNSSSQAPIIESVIRVASPSIQKEIIRTEDSYKIWKQANYDALTNLPNRNYLFKSLEKFTDSEKQISKFALLYIDLDDFKDFNDTYGHHFGDLVLIEAGKKLKKTIRSGDKVFRIGGDEFSIIISDLKDRHVTSLIANKIIDEFAQPVMIEGKKIQIGCSIGITVFPDDSQGLPEAISNADQAMYVAKNTGKNRYIHFTAEINEKIKRQSLIQHGIKNAIGKNQFSLNYQPIINLATEKVVIVEALIRWKHPELGQIPPDEFIVYAEQTGEILKITLWVVDAVCRLLATLPKDVSTNIKFAVNISPALILNTPEKFMSALLDKLNQYRQFKNQIVLEITENIFIKDSQIAFDLIEKLRDEGIEVAMDDFGVGYSSLGYLKDFNFNILKIDKYFVSNLANNPKEQIVFNAIVELAHKLGMTVVAEGIEDSITLDIIKKSGTDLAQGYLFSKPIEKNLIVKALYQSLNTNLNTNTR